jgi:Fur family transcriptional regulator, ferric uptake regulator
MAAAALGFVSMPRRARVSAALVSLIEEGKRHAWTLEELHAGLSRRGNSTDFSSVFRAAEKLAAGGEVRKLLLEDGRTRFELASAHHDHLYCIRCHALEAVPCLVAHDDFRALERKTGHAILEHHLVLNGICGKCRRGRARKRRA